MTPLRDIAEIILYALVASLPAVIGFAAAYVSPTYRTNIVRSSVNIALSFVGVVSLIAVYYLFQHVVRNDPYWPDTVQFVTVYGFLLVVLVAVYTLALSAVGLRSGAYVASR